MKSCMRVRGLAVGLAAVAIGLTRPAPAGEDPNAVFVMQPDGGQVRRVARVDEVSYHANPRWSHDGKRLSFDTFVAATKVRKVYVVDADGTQLREIAPHSMPDWSPDDKQLVTHHFLGGNAPPEVIVQNSDGQGRELVGNGRSPRWSPDGSKLLLSDITMLRTVDLVSGEETPLLSERVEQIFSGFDWSPDGKQLAVVVRSQPNGPRELFFVDARGAAFGLKSRLKTGAGGAVSFSPDGKQLVLATQETIHLVDVQGTSQPRPIPGQQGHNHTPAWSPDGKWIVFVSDRK